MKAYFAKGGVLTVEAETPLEEFALYHWSNSGEYHGVLFIKMDENNGVHCGGAAEQEAAEQGDENNARGRL